MLDFKLCKKFLEDLKRR